MKMKSDGRGVFFSPGDPDESLFSPERWPRIPSQVYPLNGFAEVWSKFNTEDCTDQKMLEVFDSISPQVGCCYQNTEDLMKAAKAAGIPEGDLVPHAGWTFCNGDPVPFHHCFAVYKRTAVFDLGAAVKSEWFPLLEGKSRDECQKLMVDLMAEARMHPNHIAFGSGQVDMTYLHVACPCHPKAARKIFQNLMKRYPNHPSYRDMNLAPDGSSAIQRELSSAIARQSKR